MDEQTYLDTIESQHEVIQIQSEEIQAKDEKIGELENIVSCNQQADKIRREKGKKRQARKSKYFTKVYLASLYDLIKHKVLASNEQALLLCLLPCLEYKTNFVIDLITKQRLNVSGIAELTGKSERQLIRIFNGLEQKGITNRVGEGQSTYFKLSEEYFYRGE